MKSDPPKEKVKKQHPENDTQKNKKTLKIQTSQTADVSTNTTPVVVEEKNIEQIPEPPTNVSNMNGIVTNTGKEKKKRKAEFNTLQQLSKSLKHFKKHFHNINFVFFLINSRRQARN